MSVLWHLWNDRLGRFHLHEDADTRYPAFVTAEGDTYYPIVGWPGYYVTPPTETALLRMVYAAWCRCYVVPDMQRVAVDHLHTQMDHAWQQLWPLLQQAGTLGECLTAQHGFRYLALKNDLVGHHEDFSYLAHVIDLLADQVAALSETPQRILEVGAGSGLMLLALKQRFPDAECVGVELSPRGVEIGQELAARFGLPVTLYTRDAADLALFADDSFDLAFTHGTFMVAHDTHARIFREMYRVTRRRLLFYEPLPELWPATPRGWAMMVYHMRENFLFGFFDHLARRVYGGCYDITRAARLRHGANPLCETAEVRLDLYKDRSVHVPRDVTYDRGVFTAGACGTVPATA